MIKLPTFTDADFGLIVLALHACASVSPEAQRPIFHELAERIEQLRAINPSPNERGH